MASASGRAPIWLLPSDGATVAPIPRGHPRLATAASLLGLAALPPVFLFLAPKSTWNPQDLFALLLSFGFVSYSVAIQLRRRVTLDAGFVAALLAAVFLGPLPAAVVFAAPEASFWLGGNRRFQSMTANLASYGWGALAASFVLTALVSDAPLDVDGLGQCGAVALAGAALIFVNWLVSSGFVSVLYDGIKLRVAFEQEIAPIIPLNAALIATAVLSAFLYDQVGVPGLAPLGGILVLPRVLTPRLIKDVPVSELERSEATAFYAQAIADVLDLDRKTKRVLTDAATHIDGSASLTQIEDLPAVMRTVLYCRERWDGADGALDALTGDEIPLESRVLAVANAWSALTAKGTRELAPEQALRDIQARAGSELDPTVVAAALGVMADERRPTAASAHPEDKSRRSHGRGPS